MPTDHIRYDLLAQEALRGMVRRVLVDAAKKGLPGDHHFFISFDTRARGVKMSPRLRAAHPEEMTVVLQHQFWDLAVTDQGFEVGLSFKGIPERLEVPFDAIKGFFDPSVQFQLQFEVAADPAAQAPGATDAEAQKPGAGPSSDPARAKSAKQRRVTTTPKIPAVSNEDASQPKPSEEAEKQADKKPEPDEKSPPSGGAEVVRLDRFRKK